MKRRKNTSGHDEHKTPSAILLSAKQQTGGGTHRESREAQNARTGRLSGKAKRDLRNESWD